MNKVILVLSDALGYQVAVEGMGYLGHLVENKLASRYKVLGELPSLSRPIYETIHTGLKSHQHEVISNQVVRSSNQPNIFQLASLAGKVTAAAAYYWFSELYNHAPFDLLNDREVDDPTLPIQHGRFYTQDSFPDEDLFATAGMLVRKYSPDYLLVHPMGMDFIGETYGSDSGNYRNHAIRQDVILSRLLVEWMSLGYNILITGDHGINKDGMHGGTTSEMRDVPLFILGEDHHLKGGVTEPISQLQIAPTICHFLQLAVPETMKYPAID